MVHGVYMYMILDISFTEHPSLSCYRPTPQIHVLPMLIPRHSDAALVRLGTTLTAPRGPNHDAGIQLLH